MKKQEKIALAQISFWLNGVEQKITVPPGLTALQLLNEKLHLHGTKSSCNEGDCGACTVIIGQMENGRIVYQTVNSCLYPAFRLHGKHLITVEGISGKDELHEVQTAMLDEHGTQCGFCTPGFVMSLLGLFLNNKNPGREEILAALEGNLCRCTGYDSIFKAAELLKSRVKNKKELLPVRLKAVEKHLKNNRAPVEFRQADNAEGWQTLNCFVPSSLAELWHNIKTCKKDGNFKLLAGGTDLMVLANIQHIRYQHLIELSGISELDYIKQAENEIHIGANVTFTQLQNSKLIQKHIPLLIKTISQMASAQIRNSATLAGNIANASPVADGATALLVLEAEVILASCRGERRIPLCKFYHGYKQTELKEDEIIKAVILPLPDKNKHYFNFIKSAKRKAVDISGVVSAVDIAYRDGKIIKAVISFGGVAPYPALAKQAMALLQGKKPDAELIEKAAAMARKEFTPISDVRGTEQYRSVLIRNHVIKHLQNLTGGML